MRNLTQLCSYETRFHLFSINTQKDDIKALIECHVLRMPSMFTIRLGPHVFPTQKALRANLLERFSKNGFGVAKQPLHDFLMLLLTRHCESAYKIGCGIKTFTLSRNPLNFKAVHIDYERIDGSTDMFSWVKCITAKRNTDLENTINAMRTTIAPYISNFRMHHHGCVQCKTKDGPFEVDHYGVEFAQLAKDFLNGTTKSEFIRTNFLIEFADKSFASRWYDYHATHSSLQLLCKECHKKKTFS
jgi:hypothetical protein